MEQQQNKTVNRVVSRCILCAKRVEQSSSQNEFLERRVAFRAIAAMR